MDASANQAHQPTTISDTDADTVVVGLCSVCEHPLTMLECELTLVTPKVCAFCLDYAKDQDPTWPPVGS